MYTNSLVKIVTLHYTGFFRTKINTLDIDYWDGMKSKNCVFQILYIKWYFQIKFQWYYFNFNLKSGVKHDAWSSRKRKIRTIHQNRVFSDDKYFNMFNFGM